MTYGDEFAEDCLHSQISVLVDPPVPSGVGLAYMVWFWHPTHPQPSTPEAAAWHIFIVALAVMIYLAIQATATLAMPVGSERRILTDLLFSMLPLLVFGYALIDWGVATWR